MKPSPHCGTDCSPPAGRRDTGKGGCRAAHYPRPRRSSPLATVDRARYRSLVDRGLVWLCEKQNTDGGWGDTVDSPSNLSTTMLCYSAMTIPGGPAVCLRSVEKTESWLRGKVGTLDPRSLATAVEQQYGKDRTFSVPILTMCALAGRLGEGGRAWRRVRPLPFELAVLPHKLFKWLRLPVVSYALPALIAMGLARYEHRRPRNPFAWIIRLFLQGQGSSSSYDSPARERRLPRSGPVDVLCCDEPGRQRASRSSGRRQRRRVPYGLDPRGWKLAHRYESCHVGHDAIDQRLVRRRARWVAVLFRATATRGLASVLSASMRASLHTGRSRRLGLDESPGRSP